jgi:hypothetical protein
MAASSAQCATCSCRHRQTKPSGAGKDIPISCILAVEHGGVLELDPFLLMHKESVNVIGQ